MVQAMTTKNISVITCLRKDQKSALDKLAKEMRLPMAEFIRNAIDAYLKTRTLTKSVKHLPRLIRCQVSGQSSEHEKRPSS
jgi:Ribbon-helix-helix protein, copG family